MSLGDSEGLKAPRLRLSQPRGAVIIISSKVWGTSEFAVVRLTLGFRGSERSEVKEVTFVERYKSALASAVPAIRASIERCVLATKRLSIIISDGARAEKRQTNHYQYILLATCTLSSAFQPARQRSLPIFQRIEVPAWKYSHPASSPQLSI